jgi:hypothetical protein
MATSRAHARGQRAADPVVWRRDGAMGMTEARGGRRYVEVTEQQLAVHQDRLAKFKALHRAAPALPTLSSVH